MAPAPALFAALCHHASASAKARRRALTCMHGSNTPASLSRVCIHAAPSPLALHRQPAARHANTGGHPEAWAQAKSVRVTTACLSNGPSHPKQAYAHAWRHSPHPSHAPCRPLPAHGPGARHRQAAGGWADQHNSSARGQRLRSSRPGRGVGRGKAGGQGRPLPPHRTSAVARGLPSLALLRQRHAALLQRALQQARRFEHLRRSKTANASRQRAPRPPPGTKPGTSRAPSSSAPALLCPAPPHLSEQLLEGLRHGNVGLGRRLDKQAPERDTRIASQRQARRRAQPGNAKWRRCRRWHTRRDALGSQGDTLFSRVACVGAVKSGQGRPRAPVSLENEEERKERATPHPCFFAKSCPSCVLTALKPSRSVLFATTCTHTTARRSATSAQWPPAPALPPCGGDRAAGAAHVAAGPRAGRGAALRPHGAARSPQNAEQAGAHAPS